MRRIAVFGPNPPCGALSADRVVAELSSRLGTDAFVLRREPGLALSLADAPALPRPANARPPTVRVDADTLVWLSFSPTVYLRDWAAGWLDALLNGAAGRRRRARRARFADVVRAFALRPHAADARAIDPLRSCVLLVELNSPQQVHFWLKMQEERVRETLPPRG